MFTSRQTFQDAIQTQSIWLAIQAEDIKTLRQIKNAEWGMFEYHQHDKIRLRYLSATPLGIAIYYGKLAVVRYLIEEHGLSYIDKRYSDFNFMCEAIRLGHLNILKYFIKKFNPILDHQLLNIAIFSGQISVAKYLVYKKWLPLHPFHHSKKDQDHLISELIKRNHFSVLKWLVDEHHFNLTDDAFILACEYGSLDMLKWVRDKIKKPLVFNEKIEQTPMYRARIGGKLASHQYLQEHQIGPPYQWISLGELPSDIIMRICDFLPPKTLFNSLKITCKPMANIVQQASFSQHQYNQYFGISQDIIEFKNFSQHRLFANKYAQVFIACITEDLASFIQLGDPQFSKLDSQSEKNKKNKRAKEFLLQAFLRPYPDSGSDYFYVFLQRTNRTLCLNYFIENDSKFFDEASRFKYAVRFGRLDIVKRLLEEKPILLSEDDALMWAARHDDVEIVLYLLQKNVNLKMTCLSYYYEIGYSAKLKNETALDWAIKHRAIHVLPILLKAYAEKAANIQHVIPSPIVYAVEKGWEDMTKVLLDYEPAYLMQKNSKGKSLLEIAVSQGFASTVEVLLQRDSWQWYKQNSSVDLDSQSFAETLLDLALQASHASTFNAITRFIPGEEKLAMCEAYFSLITTVLAKLDGKIASLHANQSNPFVNKNSIELAEVRENLINVKQQLEDKLIAHGSALQTM